MFESPFVMEQVKRWRRGAKAYGIKSIRALEIPVPPLFEQVRIADFLTDRIGSIGCLEKSLKGNATRSIYYRWLS
jgi:hypothetical protein